MKTIVIMIVLTYSSIMSNSTIGVSEITEDFLLDYQNFYNDIISYLKESEGYSKKMYRCTNNRLTIGYGYRIPSRKLKEFKHGVSIRKADELLRIALESKLEEITIGFPTLTSKQRLMLASIAYNVGYEGLLDFKRFLWYYTGEDYEMARKELMDSKMGKELSDRYYKFFKEIYYQLHKEEYGVYSNLWIEKPLIAKKTINQWRMR